MKKLNENTKQFTTKTIDKDEEFIMYGCAALLAYIKQL